ATTSDCGTKGRCCPNGHRIGAKPEVAEVPPPSLRPDTPTDPLDDFAVLPIASDEEVVIARSPGDGWLPVGADPLPGVLTLATASELELDDTGVDWAQVTPAPGDAPMIFATKPR
ncbi:MAG: hypothetical protein K2V38_14005, partial [Gemmataceae bacterium]|nr:hypothetical protein [Gemmataceae bacterium]